MIRSTLGICRRCDGTGRPAGLVLALPPAPEPQPEPIPLPPDDDPPPEAA